MLILLFLCYKQRFSRIKLVIQNIDTTNILDFATDTGILESPIAKTVINNGNNRGHNMNQNGDKQWQRYRSLL